MLAEGSPGSIMVLMQNPKAGRDQEHVDWCVNRQLPAVCAVPGVCSGDIVSANGPDRDPRWTRAAIYWLRGKPGPVFDRTLERLGGKERLIGDATDSASVMMTIGDALRPRAVSAITPDRPGDERLFYVVLANCTVNEDEFFNSWYDDIHIPDVLAVPAFLAAQRFRLVGHPALPPCPFRYLALYEVLACEAEAAFANLQSRVNTPRMMISPTLVRDGIYAVAMRTNRIPVGP